MPSLEASGDLNDRIPFHPYLWRHLTVVTRLLTRLCSLTTVY